MNFIKEQACSRRGMLTTLGLSLGGLQAAEDQDPVSRTLAEPYPFRASDDPEMRFAMIHHPAMDDAAVVFVFSPDRSLSTSLEFHHRSTWRQVSASTFLVVDRTSRRNHTLLWCELARREIRFKDVSAGLFSRIRITKGAILSIQISREDPVKLVVVQMIKGIADLQTVVLDAAFVKALETHKTDKRLAVAYVATTDVHDAMNPGVDQ